MAEVEEWPPQGSVLMPLRFNIYTNDNAERINFLLDF